MPGTPAFSPNYNIPRYSNADSADFATQVNALTDIVDADAAKRGAIVDADIAAGAAINASKVAGLELTSGGWTALTLPAGYTGGLLISEGIIPAPQYQKLASGLVVFRGILLHNFSSGTFPTGLTFGPLPSGFRPASLDLGQIPIFVGDVDSGPSIVDTLQAFVTLQTDGNIVVKQVFGEIFPTYNNQYLLFNGLSFSTA